MSDISPNFGDSAQPPQVAHNSNEEQLQFLIDQFVEGELSADDQRRLLAKLDAAPEGWKQCAMAFWEAQSWRRSIGELMKQSHVQWDAEAPSAYASLEDASPAGAATYVQPARKLYSKTCYGVLVSAAMAAALMAGVFLGRATSRIHRPIANSPAAPGDPKASEPSNSPNDDRDTDHSASSQPPSDKAPLHSNEPTDNSASPDGSSPQVVGLVRLEGGSETPVSVPLLAGEGLDEKWLLEQPPPLSEYELRQWEREGWRVEQDRQLISIELADGGRLTIPLDNVRYQFVGQDVY